MNIWILYAFISMFFAGFTSVIAKRVWRISLETLDLLYEHVLFSSSYLGLRGLLSLTKTGVCSRLLTYSGLVRQQ